MPITKYGLPQAAIYPALITGLMIVFWLFASFHFPESIRQSTTGAFFCIWLPELILLTMLIWVLSFFRDPVRDVPDDPTVLLSPADGKITDIEFVEQYPGFEGRVQKIGIFLSIFNVHINRMPCEAKVEKITYKPGAFANAMDPKSAKINESNELMLRRTGKPADPLLVRQISGAIARHIVCRITEDETYTGGRPFGMIKFGSRTELIYPAREKAICLVQIGDKVRAGETVLVRYEE